LLILHAFIALIVICIVAAFVYYLLKASGAPSIITLLPWFAVVLIVLIWIAKNYNALWSAI